MKNRILASINNDIWKNVNKIARLREHSTLYRGHFSEQELEGAKVYLNAQWTVVSPTTLGEGEEPMVLVDWNQ